MQYLLLKKMTEKTIPNPNPAPVRRNTVSKASGHTKRRKTVQFFAVILCSDSGIAECSCFSTPNKSDLNSNSETKNSYFLQ